MKKIFIPIFISLCLIAYIVGYATTTTTDNLSLILPDAEDETLDWYDNTNTNFGLIDDAFDDLTAYIADLIGKEDFKDQDWGDMSVSTNSVTLDEDVVDATALKDDNAPADGDIFTYELTGTTGHWMTLAELSIQPLDGTLTALAGLTISTNSLIYGTGADAFSVLATNATATNKFLREVSSGAPSWEILEAGDIPDISATYQPLDTALTNISALAYVSPSFIKLTADDTYAVRTLAQTLTDIGGAASGANSDITSLTGLTTPLAPDYGGTGVANNTASTLTISGNFATTLTVTEATGVTLPASGTLYGTLAASISSANLLSSMSNETGTGALVFGTSPTFTTQITTPKVTSAGALAINSADNNDITIQPNGTGDTRIYAPADVVTTVTAVHTMTIAEAGTVLVSCAATPYTITLPTAVGHSGLRYHFIKTDANYFLITIDGDGTETINYENSTSAPALTYPRLNTYCAEVTMVSDGSNWQVIDEAMGQVPYAVAELLGAQQEDLTTGQYSVVTYDTEVKDIGSNFNIGTWVSGNCTSTSANHVVDTGGAFTSAMVNNRIKNTTDSTYTYITAYNSATDITVRDDIFVDTEGYEVKYSRFTAPIAGTYEIVSSILWLNLEVDKTFGMRIYKNTSTNILGDNNHSSQNAGLSNAVFTKCSLAIGDFIDIRAYHNMSSSTPDIYNNKAQMIVRLVSKD